MIKAKRADNVINLLKQRYKNVEIALQYSNPFELLAATILSAQCTDEQVNKVTAVLFKKYRSIEAYAQADPAEMEVIVHSAGFFRNKTKNIINTAKIIVDKFGGKVPETMEDLTTLPGVARKTANIVLGHCFRKTEGIAVDTHVIRISRLLALTEEKDPVKIEKDLINLVLPQNRLEFSLLIQTLGRQVCKATRPQCPHCPLLLLCPSAKHTSTHS
ncbi:MAG: endonuclease III [Elusimicrobiota bacterium]|jgi:endonuclease-3|nr:endonuclease III [Elusimicrobiota bacterium]